MIKKLTIGWLLLTLFPLMGYAWIRGIYLTQPTLESTRTVKYLIAESKAVGINTFVVDFWGMSRRYQQNIALVKQNNLRYVARIVMFPYGATDGQVHSREYLQKRYRQILQAVSLGADAIQLDYIRYKPTQRQSYQNARNIYTIIREVRELLRGKGVGLQVDIFGEVASIESLAIGQSAPLFAASLDALCPMVYPSHYEPFRYHAVRPYETVYKSLTDLRRRLSGFPDVSIYAYIELFNYRYPLSHESKVNYILSELRAVRDAQADGWYAWSANNKYRLLFAILRGNHY